MPMRAERMRAVLDTMRLHSIYPIARIVVVKDPLLLLSMRYGSAATGAGIRWARGRCKFNDAVSEFTTEPATFRACCET